jgi:hypothetical protein
MYFGVTKIVFESDRTTGSELKDAKALCEKLTQKLKVCAKTSLNSDGGLSAIGVAGLARTEDDINSLLDKVLEICDSSDLGRVEAEYSVVEHIDVLEEEDGEPEPE